MLQYNQTSTKMKYILIVVLVIICFSASAKSSLLDSAKQTVENAKPLNPSIKDMDVIFIDSIFRFKVGDQIIEHKILEGETATGIVLAYLRGNHNKSNNEVKNTTYDFTEHVSGAVNLSPKAEMTETEKQAMQLSALQNKQKDKIVYYVWGFLSIATIGVNIFKLYQKRNKRRLKEKTKAAIMSIIKEEQSGTEEMAADLDMVTESEVDNKIEKEHISINHSRKEIMWESGVAGLYTWNLLPKIAVSLLLLLFADSVYAGNGDIAAQVNLFFFVLAAGFIMCMFLIPGSASKNVRKVVYLENDQKMEEKPVSITAIKLWNENESKGTIESFFEELREYNKQYISE